MCVSLSLLASVFALASADTLRLEVGSPQVDGRVYKPHAARVRVRVGDDPTVTTEWTNELTLGDSAGKRVMRWVTKGTQYGANGSLTWEIRQTYDARTMAPYGYASSTSSGAYSRLRIDGLRVQGTKRTALDPTVQTVDMTLDRLGFIASATDLVPVAVGLKKGAVMTAPVWGPSMARAEVRIFTVLDQVSIPVEGATTTAWKVLEHRQSDGKLMATWWLTHDSPYMVYGEVTLPNGKTQKYSEVEISLPTRGALRTGALVVRNVSVVPMTSERVMADAAVLVRNGRIEWVGPRRELKVPTGAQVVDGQGGYLMPGLADMHTHLFSDGDEVADSAGPSELAVMLANGLTAVRFMIGTPEQLVLRRDVIAGRVIGPQLWIASPQLTGRPSENAIVVTTAEEARAAVRTVAAAGYDFVKLTLFISSAVYDAVIDEAKLRGIRVVGHVEPEVGVERALAAGQQLEHLDAYLEAVLADSSPTKKGLTQGGVFQMANWRSIDYVDDRKIARIAGATARAGVFVGPTQNVFNTAFAIGESEAVVKARPDYALWPTKMRALYHRAHARYWAPANDTIKTAARRQKYVDTRNRLVKAIQDSGGKIIAGSDTPEWFHAYGYGLHRELQALVGAGLTPYQAIVTATRAPAEYLGTTADWGTLEVGKRADFILVSGNPLADIRNTERIQGVGAGGMWYSRAQLDAMITRAQRVITAGSP